MAEITEALGTERFDLVILNRAPLPFAFEVVAKGEVQKEGTGMVFKKESVLERLKRLEEVLSNLETKSGVSLEEYQSKTDLQWIIERGLEVASTIVFDIGNPILAGVYRAPAQGYEEILEELWKKGVLSDELYWNLRDLEDFGTFLYTAT